MARIQRTEIVLRHHRAPVIRRLQVQIDKLVDRAAAQKPKTFGHGQGRGHRADEGRADSLSGEQRHAAAVALAIVEHPRT
jgi:hypothetical protein